MFESLKRRLAAKAGNAAARHIETLEAQSPGTLTILREEPVVGQKAPDITTGITYCVYLAGRRIGQWNPDPDQVFEPAEALNDEREVKGHMRRNMVIQGIVREAREAAVEPKDMTPEQRLRGPVFRGGEPVKNG